MNYWIIKIIVVKLLIWNQIIYAQSSSFSLLFQCFKSSKNQDLYLYTENFNKYFAFNKKMKLQIRNT